MAGQTTEPLTPEQAKHRLRQAASRIGIVPWVRRQPVGAVLSGVLTGYLAGRIPHLWSRLSHSRVGKRVIDRWV